MVLVTGLKERASVGLELWLGTPDPGLSSSSTWPPRALTGADSRFSSSGRK